MNYQQTTEFLFNTFPLFQNIGAGAYKEGLDNIRTFCKILGNPQNDYHTIHIAGTNGKGSVAHTIASILNKTGYRVGLFTSPHLTDFRERIKIDGEMVNEKEVVDFVTQYGKQMKEAGLSFFEMTTAMAFYLFSKNGVEVAVIETGLGGRLDATNIIRPVLSVITNIGLEHTSLLGDTIEKIAAEKAGIIKNEVPVVIGESNQQSAPVFINAAKQSKSDIVFADKIWHIVDKKDCGVTVKYMLTRNDNSIQAIDYDLKGNYQDRNIVTVMTAVDMIKKFTPLNISTRALILGCREAARSTGLHGRWQTLSNNPLTICDTAHNAHGLEWVVKQIKQQQYNKLYMIFGMVNDKDFNKIMPLLPEGEYIFTQPSVARALPAAQLQAKAAEFAITGRVITNVTQAYEIALAEADRNDMIFIGGSSFVVADLLKSIK